MELTSFQEFFITMITMLFGLFVITAPLRKFDKQDKEYYREYFKKHNIPADYLEN